MPNSGQLSPNTCVNRTGFGTNSWNNPQNAPLESTGNSRNANLSNGEQSLYLYCYDFNVSVPLGALVQGLEFGVNVRDANGGNMANDVQVYLVKSGNIVGSLNKANNANIPSVFDYIVYGGQFDQWGETLTPSQLESSDFGLLYAVEGVSAGSDSDVDVDGVYAKVYYEQEDNEVNVSLSGSTLSINMTDEFRKDFADIQSALLMNFLFLGIFISMSFMIFKRLHSYFSRRFL